MKTRIAILGVLIAGSAGGGTLGSEAAAILERLYSQGYTGVARAGLILDLMEPCTLGIYPPEETCSDGYYLALGGNNILDLGLRLEGEGWFLEDTFPDDVPVLRVDSAAIAGGYRLIVCAEDMIRGSMSDSAVVMWAYAPVDRDP
jgi:hypothetical protein